MGLVHLTSFKVTTHLNLSEFYSFDLHFPIVMADGTTL